MYQSKLNKRLELLRNMQEMEMLEPQANRALSLIAPTAPIGKIKGIVSGHTHF